MSKPILLLVDADIVAYQAAVIAQVSGSWSDNEHHVYGFMQKEKAIAHIEGYLLKIKAKTSKDAEVVMCLSGKHNFRDDVVDYYKGNRSFTARPIGLGELKEYILENYPSDRVDNLEADDLMGIYATDPNYRPDCLKVVVSEDKDLQTIPTYLLNPAKDDKPRAISLEDADKFHLTQAFAGDMTDGYAGCPDIGMDSAMKIITEPFKKVAYDHTFKTGKRKGLIEVRYKKETVGTAWEAIVAHYEHAGLSESVAIENARLARILRHGEYDFESQEVSLWDPTGEFKEKLKGVKDE